MATIDYAVIALYFIVVIGLGFWYRKRAAQDLEAYFLGGKRMHWLALAMSGSVSNFDITGTMWIVSMLVLMGMRSMWIHWMWGWMMGAFFLAYMGKWVRRSNVMTGAEWMVTRFGHGLAGQVARMSAAIMAFITMCGMIGYAFQGIGKFAHVYFPAYGQNTLALIIIGATTFYVLLGGLFSVVVTDVIQTVIVTLAAIIIGGVAYTQLTPDTLAAALPADWASLMPKWRLAEFAGTDNGNYELFGALVIVWVVKGFLLNAGGPGGMYEMQRFLAARDARDAAKIGAAWSGFMVVRWGMAMGITLLALTSLSHITDSEQVMPMVLQEYLPVGLKGFVIAGLLAAFMSTFSSTVNSGASYVVRDLYEPFIRRIRPNTTARHLVLSSYAATIAVVVAGIAIGLQTTSIAQIWEWLMTALGAGVIMPNILRWYWWRMNGWGYAAGTLGGILLSLVPLIDFSPLVGVAVFFTVSGEPSTIWSVVLSLAPYLLGHLPMYVVFPPIAIGSLIACIVGTLITRPVDDATLIDFYTKVRPFGIWAHIREASGLSQKALRDPSESPGRAILNTVLGMVAVTGAYLFPMFLVGHWHARAVICFGAAALAIAVLSQTWYKHLPRREEG